MAGTPLIRSAAQAVSRVHACERIDALGFTTQLALILAIEQRVTEISAFNAGSAEAAAGGDHTAQVGVAQVSTGEIGSIHQRVGQIGVAEISLREGALGQDRSAQIRVTEVSTASNGAREGGVGKVLTMKVTTALVGERVIDGFLEQSPILKCSR